jgi:hypothetical protein
MPKVHYFDQDTADIDDLVLRMAKNQGYVPQNCLLGGQTVWGIVTAGDDPCRECKCDRSKCHGRPAAVRG